MTAPSAKTPILIIVENLPVPPDRRVWQEACALRDAGYEVIVICPKMRGYTQSEEMLDGIQIYRHWISLEGRGFVGFVAEYATALWGEFWLSVKAWRRHRFKLMHLCNPPDLLYIVALPFKLLGVKVVFDVHDLWPEMFEAKFKKRGLLYWAVRAAERSTHMLADVSISTNETVKAIAINRGKQKPENVFIVRTAPKIGALDAPSRPELKRGREFLIGYVGVMGSADGVDYVIEAARHLIQVIGRKDVQFLLMGSGPEYDRLLALRDQWGLQEYVDMPGWLGNEDLFPALQTIDLGVSGDPPNSYNHGCTMNKVLEYMAFGKPQVLFDLVEGRASAQEAAVYVQEPSGIKLAEAINELLNDPARRARMGEFGARRLKNDLGWGRSVEQLLAAYQKALK